jgi:hypothetical protein
MRDQVIDDIREEGEWDGIYGSYSDLGLDMFGDLRLDDLPPATSRVNEKPPTTESVVVPAIATKVQKPVLKATPVTKTPEAPAPSVTPITPKKVITPVKARGVSPSGKKLIFAGALAAIAYFLLKKD